MPAWGEFNPAHYVRLRRTDGQHDLSLTYCILAPFRRFGLLGFGMLGTGQRLAACSPSLFYDHERALSREVGKKEESQHADTGVNRTAAANGHQTYHPGLANAQSTASGCSDPRSVAERSTAISSSGSTILRRNSKANHRLRRCGLAVDGVSFDFSKSGVNAFYYDGARKIGDFTVSEPVPVPFSAEIHSNTQPVNFGNAVIVIGRGFSHWMSLVRKMELLAPDAPEDKAILEDLSQLERQLVVADPFPSADRDRKTNLDQLSAEDNKLARDDPAAFAAKFHKPEQHVAPPTNEAERSQ